MKILHVKNLARLVCSIFCNALVKSGARVKHHLTPSKVSEHMIADWHFESNPYIMLSSVGCNLLKLCLIFLFINIWEDSKSHHVKQAYIAFVGLHSKSYHAETFVRQHH